MSKINVYYKYMISQYSRCGVLMCNCERENADCQVVASCVLSREEPLVD